MVKRIQSDLILAGDVGGTKTRLGLLRVGKQKDRWLALEVFPSGHYCGLEEVLEDFLRRKALSKGEIASACFGVAGPATGKTASGTNLPWVIRTTSLQRTFAIERLELINDIVALSYGLSQLKRQDLDVLHAGIPRRGNRVLIAAGTGLGQAILVWDGQKHIPSASEGGHVDFAPRDRLEMDLLEEMIDRYGHVSYERVLSGPGLVEIYRFLKGMKTFGAEPKWLSERLEREDPPEVISETARLKRSRLCEKALDLFCSIYGRAAGNLALQGFAMGGVYVGGGIAPKILWKLRDGGFLRSFAEKGRLSEFLFQIPIKVILNDEGALLGAAQRAKELLLSEPGHRLRSAGRWIG